MLLHCNWFGFEVQKRFFTKNHKHFRKRIHNNKNEKKSSKIADFLIRINITYSYTMVNEFKARNPIFIQLGNNLCYNIRKLYRRIYFFVEISQKSNKN